MTILITVLFTNFYGNTTAFVQVTRSGKPAILQVLRPRLRYFTITTIVGLRRMECNGITSERVDSIPYSHNNAGLQRRDYHYHDQRPLYHRFRLDCLKDRAGQATP